MNSQAELPQEAPQSGNLNSRDDLIQRLRQGHSVRTRFVESHLDKKLAFQVRSLRGESSQEDVEKLTGIKQQVFSRLENPSYGKATLTTLKRIAAAFDVGLLVEFVPFSQLVNRVSGTPYVERGFSPETMNVPSFTEEEELGALAENPSSDDVLLRLNKLYPEVTPTGVSDNLTVQHLTKQAENSAKLDVSAPSASGAIRDPMPQLYLVRKQEPEIHALRPSGGRKHRTHPTSRKRPTWRTQKSWQMKNQTKSRANKKPNSCDTRTLNPGIPTMSNMLQASGT
jgi:transcriptional regulator with XRE-family HTH domain